MILDDIRDLAREYPGTFTSGMLAARLGLKVTAVVRRLRVLERSGYLERVQVGKPESNRYHWRVRRETEVADAYQP